MHNGTLVYSNSSWREKLELLSKIFAVLTAFAIPLSTAATNILIILAVICTLAAGNWRAKFNIIGNNPIAVLLLIYYLMYLIGATYATGPFKDTLFILRKYDKFLFAALLIPIFTEARVRDYAINAFVLAVMIMLFAAFCNALGWIHYLKWGGVEMFKTHIEFNFLLAFTGYLCLLKVAAGIKRHWLWALLLLLVLYGMFFLSSGRSGYFVFIGLVMLFFVERFKWRGLVIASISVIALVAIAYLGSHVFRERIMAIASDVQAYSHTDQTSLGLRMSFAKNSIKIISAHPIIGTGTGSFAYEYANLKPTPNPLMENPHDEYLFTMVQFGVVGLIVLLVMLAWQLKESKRLPENLRYLARGVILAIVMGCFANSWLRDTTEGHFYVYFIAVAFAALPRVERRPMLYATTNSK